MRRKEIENDREIKEKPQGFLHSDYSSERFRENSGREEAKKKKWKRVSWRSLSMIFFSLKEANSLHFTLFFFLPFGMEFLESIDPHFVDHILSVFLHHFVDLIH